MTSEPKPPAREAGNKPAAASAPASAPRRDRRSFVISMIGLAVLLFIATETLLYYRWATMTEPTCLLIVDFSEGLRGAQVEVDGVMLAHPHKVVVGDHDRFSVPFYLEPGRYAVKITMNEDTLFQSEVELTKEQRGLRLDLRKLVAPSASTTTPPPATAPAPPF